MLMMLLFALAAGTQAAAPYRAQPEPVVERPGPGARRGGVAENTPRLTGTLYLAVAGDDDRGDAVKAMGAALRTAAPKGLT